ncbi:MAG: T9SS type A sorting domain-containing protein [Bacteroidota bacterium]
MKKCLLVLSIVFCFAIRSNGQAITSVANGNWYNPTTWSCTCLPSPTDSIIVNHTVVLDNNFALNGGSITVGTNGVLKENTPGRYLVMNAGYIENKGKIKISRVGFFGGEFNNLDSCLFYSVFYSGAYVTNQGSISGIDSLFIDAYFFNDASGIVTASETTVNDTLYNIGQLNFIDMWNTGVFYNYNITRVYNLLSTNIGENDEELTYYNFSNTGEFENYGFMQGYIDASNFGYLLNDETATFVVENNFMNADTAAHLALLENEGEVYVGGNFYNLDTITGINGRICVKMASTNAGAMNGSFDFCDLSGSGHPDLMVGAATISPDITFCTYPCVEGTTSPVDPGNALSVYPNPTTNQLFFEFSDNVSNTQIVVTDVLGNVVFNQSGIQGKLITFTKGNLPAGFYFYLIKSDKQQFAGKIILQ